MRYYSVIRVMALSVPYSGWGFMDEGIGRRVRVRGLLFRTEGYICVYIYI